MSENNDYLGMNSQSRLYGDILILMLIGAGYALVACLAVWLVIAVIVGIGRALPEDSRQTPDPINRSSLEFLQTDIQAV